MQPFVEQEFNTWKSQVDTEERGKTQNEKKNSRTTYNTHTDTGSYREKYSYNYHSDYHTDKPGTKTGSSGYYHSDNHSDTPSSKTPYSYTYSNHTDGRPHYDYGSYGMKHHDSPGRVHTDRKYHGDSHVDDYRHKDSGSGYTHKDGFDYTPHGDSGSSELKHRDNHVDTPHSDSGHSGIETAYSYKNTHTDNNPHTDYGFNHNDFVPSQPRVFGNETSTIPRVKDNLIIGVHSYDKDKDEPNQTSRSTTVEYQIKIRQVEDLAGKAVSGSWETLQTFQAKDRLNLNTKLKSEGIYEIQVVARNAPINNRNGVSQSFESETQTKRIKIQQNIDPEFEIDNYTSFIGFTFGKDAVLSPSDKLRNYKKYSEFSTNNKKSSNTRGVFVNVIASDKDKGQHLRGKVRLLTPEGEKINETESKIIWIKSNSEVAISDGENGIVGQAFVPFSSLDGREGGNYSLEVEIRDYDDAGTGRPTGAVVKKNTISTSDNKTNTIALDMVIPTINIEAPSGKWVKDNQINVKVDDEFIGVSKWRYRVETNGKETQSWVSLKGNIKEKSILLDKTGVNKVYVEVWDKVNNFEKSELGGFKNDNTSPTVKVTTNPKASGEDKVWTGETVEITVEVSDPDSGVASITKPDFTTVTGGVNKKTLTTKHIVSDNNEDGYVFTFKDTAGNEGKVKVPVTNIDVYKPAIKGFKAINILESSVEVEVTGAEDKGSGLHDKPYSYRIKGEEEWSEWQASNKFTFTGLNPNTDYEMEVKVRDIPGNEMPPESVKLTTLTNDIVLTKTKEEGSNEVILDINMNGNPMGSDRTETQITRQNMITGEIVTIKSWSKETTFLDRVPTFVVGYRYTAYARNNGTTRIVGNASTVEVKDIEEPTMEVLGVGADKYTYDTNSQSLYLFGNTSNMVEFRFNTKATEKIRYQVYDRYDPANPENNNIIKEGDMYGRVGEYRYDIQTPINPEEHANYWIKVQGYVNGEYIPLVLNPGEDKGSDSRYVEKLEVCKIDKISDLYDIKVDEVEGKYEVSYKLKIEFKDEFTSKMAQRSAVTFLFNSVSFGTGGTSTTVAVDTGKATLNKGDLTLSKEVGGGIYKETFKEGQVLISTNIDDFVTNVGEGWSLQVRLSDRTGGTYNLPEDMASFLKDGYSIEVKVEENRTSTEGETKSDKYHNITPTTTYTDGDMVNLKYTEAKNAVVGIKVTKVLPTYHVELLNLQSEESKSNTLDAIGNPNTQYDKTFLYNKITSKMEPHGVTIHSGAGGRWDSILYYRSGKPNNLLMVSKDAITVYGTDLKKKERITGDEVANYGSEVFNNKLYLATDSGIKEVDSDGKVKETTYNSKITGMATDGSKLFVIDSTGLKILGSNLEETQALTNKQIFKSNVEIKTIWVSSGKIYVSKSLEGTEYVVIGK